MGMCFMRMRYALWRSSFQVAILEYRSYRPSEEDESFLFLDG